MKKKIGMGIASVIILAFLIGGIAYIATLKKESPFEPDPITGESVTGKQSGFNVVLSLEDKITENTAWCGTFNLIWNDLKNDLAKQDIIFTPQLEIVKNLNKGTFHSTYLSEDSYYKVYGKPTLALKGEIEEAIKRKFNETSDILDNFDWEDRKTEDYFLYAMLKKQFEFPKEFTELENGDFGNYENIKYFGIDKNTKKEVRDQVKVLYYHNSQDFAVKLLTKQKDEVILTRGSNKENFGEIYEEIKQESEEYKGNKSFQEVDTLKIPTINFNLKRDFLELENKLFRFANGENHEIEKALQTIQFELDKKGGKIKSEAGMMVTDSIAIEEEARGFLVEDTFMIFLIEEEKELPYFAAKITDITQVQ